MADSSPETGYAMELANGSYEWYRSRAVLTRRAHRVSEVVLLVVSAAIPISAVLWSTNAVVPAILGAVIVVVSGMRTAFHWHENYIRFSRAREAVEFERRLYRTRAAPYGDAATRDQVLVTAVSRIEHEEMAGWVTIASRARSEEPTSEPGPA
ncbi:DUF4231 domain-containing protein [Allokutzneria oryzae]|uniref:DUF4231 domain-containing protein n=1 Tax=Allokutzneria oryzae TaxID=1378989 RepID=A0ABV5ZXL0_9PSEU